MAKVAGGGGGVNGVAEETILALEADLLPATPRRWRIDPYSVAHGLCCLYVLSQVYMVPVWLVGPSWSTWPSLTDLTVLLMLFWLPLVRQPEKADSNDIIVLKRLLLVMTGGALASYVLLTLNILPIKSEGSFNDKGQDVGLYQLYRLAQFLVLFWLTLKIDWNKRRLHWLRRVLAFTFWASSALLLLDYFDLLSTSLLSPHIPKDLRIAGPWAFFARGTVGNPVGGISFHHAYPSVQLLLLAATYILLLPAAKVWIPSCVLICLSVCSLVSGSRAGFVGISVFVAMMVAFQPRRLFVIIAIAALSTAAFLCFFENFYASFSRAIERQESIATSYESDGLAGRVDIWNERVALLNRNPICWITGTGFGSAIESGHNGHMLYLQTVLECGLIGTAAMLILFSKILSAMWRRGGQTRTMCFATSALLVSAVTQETFYPVPAFGHFCGMYLFCVAIALTASGRFRGRKVVE